MKTNNYFIEVHRTQKTNKLQQDLQLRLVKTFLHRVISEKKISQIKELYEAIVTEYKEKGGRAKIDEYRSYNDSVGEKGIYIGDTIVINLTKIEGEIK